MKPATSSAADGLQRGSEGFALFELLAMLGIAGLLTSVALPRGIDAYRAAEVHGLAADLARMLRSDRNAALKGGRDVRTAVDIVGRRVLSPSDQRVLSLPRDIDVRFVHSSREDTDRGGSIRFGPRGESSGGTFFLQRGQTGYRVQVDWLTSRVTSGPWSPQGEPAGPWSPEGDPGAVR